MHAQLTLRVGRDVGRSYVLRMGQRFVLGRVDGVTVRVDDDKVSRQHVALELTPQGVVVTDLGSRNGSFLAGEPLPANLPRLAEAEDTLQIGEHVFHIELGGMDERTRQARAKTQRLDEPLLSREEFEILGQIGRGAMGRVYAARQKLLGRNVAIKMLKPEAGADAEYRARFLREGRLALRVDNDYVVEVFDVRVVGDRVYLVMELINGPSVKDRLSAGPLPLDEALQIAEHVALALEAAHRVGVIHRDIKPANILLSPEGRAKLSDFGIAKDLESLESLTVSGEGLGTLAYVAPEQATDAKLVDHRADLYSLGATIYHMLAGRPPFQPRTARVLLEILEQQPPPLLGLRPDCPSEVADLVHRLLSKLPAERPASAAAVASTLRRLREEHAPSAPIQPAGWGEGDARERTEGFDRTRDDGL